MAQFRRSMAFRNTTIPLVVLTASLLCLINQRFGRAFSFGRTPRIFHHVSSTSISPLNDKAPNSAATGEDQDTTDVSSQLSSHSLRPRRQIRGSFRRKNAKRNRDFRLNYKDLDEDFHSADERRLHKRILSKLVSLAPLSDEKILSKEDTIVPIEAGMVHLHHRSTNNDNVSYAGDENYVALSSPPITNATLGAKSNKKKPIVITNVHELREAVLDHGIDLRDLELKYVPPRSLMASKRNVEKEFLSGSGNINDDLNIISLSNNTLLTAFNSNLSMNALPKGQVDIVIEEESALQNLTRKQDDLFPHQVLNLLHQRYHSHSTPSSRAPNDTAILALAIEGGGMRGAVSGGMAAAIVCLGLSNAFDSVYGSSAGSIIGSYFVSRQLYLDVYTDVIPAGFDLFVSKAKIIGDIFRNLFRVMKGSSWKKLNSMLVERFKVPKQDKDMKLLPTREGGLNISFVLDSIMCPNRGLRPLDLESFAHNDEVQPMRIVSSAVDLETGMLKTVVFGSREGHFSDRFANLTNVQMNVTSSYPEIQSAQADDRGCRRGLWACLGASMTVPGAAGSPFRMDLPSSNGNEASPHLCFDAFCYEPIPFRSAVAEGATHVLALRSRPAGFEPKTKPTLYERAVAPLYFRSHGVNTVAEFFENGGQQYLYAEDVLTCDEGLESNDAIPIPPAAVLYSAPEQNLCASNSTFEQTGLKDRNKWKRAHLLPITVPADVPELSTLSENREEILAGIRSGFAAAYDALAPVVGLETSTDIDGMKVAELVFPSVGAPLETVVLQLLPGEKLEKQSRIEDVPSSNQRRENIRQWLSSKHRSLLSQNKTVFQRLGRSRNIKHDGSADKTSGAAESLTTHDPGIIMSFLPGVQLGNLPLVSERLQIYLESQQQSD